MPQALTIEFHHDGSEPADAPPPVPMRQVFPGWLAAMPAAVPEPLRRPEDVTRLTLRGCAPLMEAMTSGYALLWPSTTRLQAVGRNPDGSFDVRYTPGRPAILNAVPPRQTPGMPGASVPMLKLISPWIIRTPEATSCLVLPLLNRPELQLMPFAAVVETDRYFAPLHFPFLFAMPADGALTVERGTPFAQIVPFRRDDWAAVVGSGDASAKAATLAILEAEKEGAYARRLRVHRQFR